MSVSFFAYKCGMTRFFTSDGLSVPATIVKVYTNYIVGIRSINNNSCLVKISAVDNKKKCNKSISGFYKSIGINNLKYMLEFVIGKNEVSDYSVGNKLNFSMFNISDKINVMGISKGKGFAGVIKRHNFSSQRATHGNSLSHRVPGSIGQCQTPGKVFKGKRMSGRMGCSKVTVKNIEILNLYDDLNIILLKGSIPGACGTKIVLKKLIYDIS